jgi:hypothetical protein
MSDNAKVVNIQSFGPTPFLQNMLSPTTVPPAFPETFHSALTVSAAVSPQRALSELENALVDLLKLSIDGDQPEDVAMIQLAIAASGIGKQLQVLEQKQGIKLQVELEQQRAIIKAAKAAAKAAKLANNPFLKAFKWIAVIITAVIAALMIVASGGTATVVAASMMMGICALTVMSEISNEVAASNGDKGGGVIPSFDKICGMLCGVLAKSAGASDEEVEKAKTWGGLALSLFIQVGISAMAMPSSALGAVAQVTGRAAESGSLGFSSAAKEAIKNAGEMFGKIDVPAFQKLAKGLQKFADETSDVELLAKALERSFFYLTGAALLSQAGDSVGTIMVGVAQKNLGDAQAEVVMKEVLLKWLCDQMEMAEEEAQEMMQQLERASQAAGHIIDLNSETLSGIISDFSSSPTAA